VAETDFVRVDLYEVDAIRCRVLNGKLSDVGFGIPFPARGGRKKKRPRIMNKHQRFH
jgi:hypothetical protein